MQLSPSASSFSPAPPLKIRSNNKRPAEFDFSELERVRLRGAHSLCDFELVYGVLIGTVRPPPPLRPLLPALVKDAVDIIVSYLPGELARQLDKRYHALHINRPRTHCGGKFYSALCKGNCDPVPICGKAGVFFKREVRIYNEYVDTSKPYDPARNDFVCYGRKMCADCFEREEQREHELHEEMEQVRQRRELDGAFCDRCGSTDEQHFCVCEEEGAEDK